VVRVTIGGLNHRYFFTPATLTIRKGTRVVWVNTTGAPHTVTSSDGGFASSGTLGNGDAFSATFTIAGTFSYQCSIHPYMTATIIVTG